MAGEKGKARKVLSVIGNILIWIFIVFAIVVTILAFAAQSSSDGVPAIAGKVILTVQTDSMSPVFDAGDIIIGQKLTEEEKSNLKVDDIITFKAGDINGDGAVGDMNSHRIVEVGTENGTVFYRTKGDNPNTNVTIDQDKVFPTDIVSKYIDVRIPKLGSFLNFLQQPTGFLLVVVLPLVLFFIYELIVFIRKFIEVKNSGKKQISAADEEEIKQKAIAEYLAQRNKAEEEKESAQDSPKEEEPKEDDKIPEKVAEEEVKAEEPQTEPEAAEEKVEAEAETTEAAEEPAEKEKETT